MATLYLEMILFGQNMTPQEAWMDSSQVYYISEYSEALLPLMIQKRKD